MQCTVNGKTELILQNTHNPSCHNDSGNPPMALKQLMRKKGMPVCLRFNRIQIDTGSDSSSFCLTRLCGAHFIFHVAEFKKVHEFISGDKL